MNEPLTLSALASSVWHDFVRARRGLFVYDILFKLLEAWLLVPAVAVILGIILSRAGHVAVSNQDILDFLLAPLGLLYAVLLGAATLALLLLELAGIMVLVVLTGGGERPPFRQLLSAFLPKVWRVALLGAIKLVFWAVTLVPFLLPAILTYRIFLSGHDIYYYWTLRPPVFWLAAGIGGLLLIAALAAGAWLYVRWALALPILLFEGQSARAALRASRERVRGVGWRVGFVLVGWLLSALLVGVVLELGFRFCAAAALENAGERPVALILVLLVVHAGLIATWSFALMVGLGLATRRLYLLRSEPLGLCPPEGLEPAPAVPKPVTPGNWRLVAYLSMPLFLLAPLALWINLSRYVADRPLVRVTAHRGHARAAPENTLSAVRKAIDSGADYAEVDVQLTADGKVVLLHDRDLKRVAGVSRQLKDMSYAEVRKLDVGSWFGPSFRGERVPTLAELIDLSRGRIRLNIELKFFGPDRRLAQDVARLLREKDFESDCLVTSLKYDALQEVKRQNPRLRTGLIVAHALGDLSRLQVDALSVRADFLSDELLRKAHRAGMEVHVWTVNDARRMIRLMKRGVDNILTSDPDLGVRVRDRWANLTGTERLVLASRLLLGLEP
jgi:glycerophosphoryl diester phosphodiesterase